MRYTSGIYSITHVDSGRQYIGSSVDMNTRWRKHKADLRRGTHHSKFMQRIWDKYGENSIAIRAIILCAPDDLLMYEQRCLDIIHPEFNGTKAANSPVHRGQKLPQAWINNAVKAQREARQLRKEQGVKTTHPPRSLAYRQAVSETVRQRWADPIYAAKNIAGIKRAVTPELCHKRSDIVKALWATPEYRKKASDSRKGNKFCLGYKCTPEQVENRKRAARISNMKRNYKADWVSEYIRRYPEHIRDVENYE